jgi:anaerobic magnesium-protoporphyrin IX monomethyl ester cyclase
MSILLVNPGWGERVSRKGRRFNRAWPPLSLMLCASLLEKAGFITRIIDGRVERDWKEKLAGLAQESEWIGLTSTPIDRWQCPNLEIEYFIDLACSLPSDKLIIMGAHGSIFPRKMIQRTNARAVIIGEPEERFLALCTQDNWIDIPGIIFRKEEAIHQTARSVPVDLSRLPMPAFDLIDPSKYAYELLGGPFALFEASRGCPYKCTFCLKAMYGPGVRYKPIDQIMAEIDTAVTRFGFRYGYFIDLEFTSNRDHAMAICDELIDRGYPLNWCCQTRLDALDAELLRRMKQAGCRLIHFGVESGSPRILREVKKGINRKTIEQGVCLTRDIGIETACFFMMGFPGESAPEMEETLQFAKNLNPTYASFHEATPYPGTILWSSSVLRSVSADLNMPFPSYCEGQSPIFLNKTLKRAYLSYYLRLPYIVERVRYGSPRSWIRQAKLFWGFIR